MEESLKKSLAQLDSLADDIVKSREGLPEDKDDAQPLDEENTKGEEAVNDPAQEPDSLNDQAKHTLENAPGPDTESGEAETKDEPAPDKSEDPNTTEDGSNDNVEKGVKPSEISEDEEDKDENNNSSQNNKKLMDKNEKKAKGTDEQDDNPGDKREKEENDDDDDEEEDQVSKSHTEEFFAGLTKSFRPGSVEEDFVDAIQKSLYYNELRAKDTEKTLNQVSEVLVKSVSSVIEQNHHLAALVKSQKEDIARLISNQTDFEKSVNTKVDAYAAEPRQRKSTANVMEKSFQHSAGLANDGELSKSETLEKLTQMAIAGENGVTAHDVMNYESSDTLRPEVERALKN